MEELPDLESTYVTLGQLSKAIETGDLSIVEQIIIGEDLLTNHEALTRLVLSSLASDNTIATKFLLDICKANGIKNSALNAYEITVSLDEGALDKFLSKKISANSMAIKKDKRSDFLLCLILICLRRSPKILNQPNGILGSKRIVQHVIIAIRLIRFWKTNQSERDQIILYITKGLKGIGARYENGICKTLRHLFAKHNSESANRKLGEFFFALTSGGHHPVALLNCASFLFHSNDYDKAIVVLDRLIEVAIEIQYLDKKPGIKLEREKSSYSPQTAFKTLASIVDVLESASLAPFLMSGTLLGAIREGDLLSFDKDIDVGVIGIENRDAVCNALITSDLFSIDKSDVLKEDLFLLPVKSREENFGIDIFFFHDMGDYFLHAIQSRLGYLEHFKFSKFELTRGLLRDRNFWIPKTYAENLAENYGDDWQIPTKDYVVNVESPAIIDKTSASYTAICFLEIFNSVVSENKTRIARIVKQLGDRYERPETLRDTKFYNSFNWEVFLK